jgi:DNA-binding protein HU-beta
MNKTELIEAVVQTTELPRASVERTLDAALDSIREELKKGATVALAGFGTFKVSDRAARAGRNPRTGEAIEIAAARVPRFVAGKGLKDALK